MFPWFFGIQTGCAVVALVTAWGWSSRDPGRAQKVRKVILALGLASVLAGWWLALLHVVSGIVLVGTIIGIPLAFADFKMVPISLVPLGKDVVSTRRGEFDRAG